MGPDEEASNLPDSPSAAAEASTAVQPERRGGRSRRGRGRRRKQKRPQAEQTPSPPAEPTAQANEAELAPEPEFEPEHQEEVAEETAFHARETPEPEPPSRTEAPQPGRLKQAPSSPTVQMAIEEVNQIINTLQDTLEDMEEVRQMLEVFERQANADEREIESLRRALRHLQRPREGGHPHRGH